MTKEDALGEPKHVCSMDCGFGAWCNLEPPKPVTFGPPTSVAYQFENRNYFPRPWTTASQFVDRMPLVPGPTPEDMPDIIKRAKQFVAGELKDEVDYSTPFAEKVLAITDSIAELLVTKNQAYGNSALDPIRIFSKVGTQEGLDVRIDDKLSRIARGHEYPGDDTLKDLIGYLIMKLIERQNEEERE